ncbi:MAG: UvrD-helicase domain-containing protein [Bacteroidales bacterium]|jgi:DNA helicase-2/ATP-dependent DNA helicase PcrA|nr:UvrD-helicase domain-containing protein [Bacteroidales bacterium]
MSYLDELNTPQREAVVNTEGPSLIIAGAGSGKTRVLTYRIARLMEMGTLPSKILALTFTNKAASEMKSRIESVVGAAQTRYLWMGTFHSIFARLLRFESATLGYPSNFTIYDSMDSRSLLKSIVKNLELDEKTYKIPVVASRISNAKNSLIIPPAYAQSAEIQEYDKSIRMPRIKDIYNEYERQCAVAGAMDFDDLLLKTNILFRNHKDILAKYQERFHYILVDEYQDTNFAQYLIVKNLAAYHHNICVVGDDAQSIYSFRGARIENIFNFRTDYPEHRVFKLEQNYRSTQTIVNAANSIIGKNRRQIAKKVFSENEEGKKIRVLQALTDNEEGILVANDISESHLLHHFLFQDYAILYRTNAQSRILEEALRKRNIPYKIYGGQSFYQRKEIKDIIAYFRLIINPKDNEALKRIINYPARGIGDTTLGKLENAAYNSQQSIFDVILSLKSVNICGFNRATLEKLTTFAALIGKFQALVQESDAFDAANNIAAQTGLIADLYNDKSPEGVSRYENIQELLNGISEFSQNAKEEGMPDKLADYMEDIALLTDQDTDKPEDRNKVTMMTIHSSKGLEFKNVYIVGLEENLFPAKAVNASDEDIEEERRLFYVALTRAEVNACLSFARQRYKWGNLEFCNPSRFLREIDARYLDMDHVSEFAERQPSHRSFAPEKPGFRRIDMPDTTMLTDKLSKLRQKTAANGDFEASDMRDIQAGMTVEHKRFGTGKVQNVEGDYPDLKATVFFQTMGQKQLILKYANLRIIE